MRAGDQVISIFNTTHKGVLVRVDYRSDTLPYVVWFDDRTSGLRYYPVNQLIPVVMINRLIEL